MISFKQVRMFDQGGGFSTYSQEDDWRCIARLLNIPQRKCGYL